jgi:uncharacterized protein YkwD
VFRHRRSLALLVTAALGVGAAPAGKATPAARWAGYGEPTATEQVLLERLNAARADPVGAQRRLRVDLTAGGRFVLTPAPPLVMNARLSAAARAHSRDMSARRFFAHVNPDGRDPGERLRQAGYSWRDCGENISAGLADPAAALDDLLVDEGVPDFGHRVSLLSLEPRLHRQDEIGIGAVTGSGPYRHYYTFALARDQEPGAFVLGVAYRDANRNGRYDAGEGLAGVRLSVGSRQTTTATAGGYGLPLPNGSHAVTAHAEGLGAPRQAQITVAGRNVKLDFVLPAAGAPAD